jgi:hypothetical protein
VKFEKSLIKLRCDKFQLKLDNADFSSILFHKEGIQITDSAKVSFINIHSISYKTGSKIQDSTELKHFFKTGGVWIVRDIIDKLKIFNQIAKTFEYPKHLSVQDLILQFDVSNSEYDNLLALYSFYQKYLLRNKWEVKQFYVIINFMAIHNKINDKMCDFIAKLLKLPYSELSMYWRACNYRDAPEDLLDLIYKSLTTNENLRHC